MSKILSLSVLALATLFLSSCGSTSSLPKEVTQSSRKFSRVVVRDFGTTVTNPKVDHKLSTARKSFPDMIVGELKSKGQFASVTRNGKSSADTLVIDGTITNYDDGNAAMRMLVGFAAGNSNFDSTVNFRDSQGKKLGTVNVDKNSWALGGALAAAQTADSFIPGAAKSVAKEASKFAR